MRRFSISTSRRKLLPFVSESDDARNLAHAVDLVLRPGQSIKRAANGLQTGGKLYLLDGNYYLTDVLELSKSGVAIVGQSRERTIIRRRVSSSNPLVKVTGTDITLENLRFVEDSITGASTVPAVQIEARYCRVRGCYFEDCGRAIYATGCSELEIVGNFVLAVRDTAYGMYFVNVDDSIVSQNDLVSPSPTSEMYFDDASQRNSIVGNVAGSGGVISYKASSNSRAAGNTPAATGR